MATPMTFHDTLQRLESKKQVLNDKIVDWYRVELSYSSNALEGTTLTRQETATILDQGYHRWKNAQRAHRSRKPCPGF